MNQDNLKLIAKNIDKISTRKYRGKEYQAYDTKFCLALTLFFKNGLQQNRKGLLKFYRQSMECIGEKELTYYLVDGQGVYKKVKKDTFDIFPFWLQDKEENYQFFSLDMESGLRESMSDRAFKICGYTPADDDDSDTIDFWVCGVRLVMPADYLCTEGVDRWLSIVTEASHDLEFIAGTSGFAMNSEYYNADYLCSDTWEAGQAGPFVAISNRYQGIDVDHYEEYVKGRVFNYHTRGQDDYRSIEAIKCVDWLTLINHKLIDKLGGVETLTEKLKSGSCGEGTIIHELPHGICIQAGPEPDVGDVNTDQANILPYYHHVGRILKPVHVLQNEYGVLQNGFYSVGNAENTKRWLQRFDD